MKVIAFITDCKAAETSADLKEVFFPMTLLKLFGLARQLTVIRAVLIQCENSPPKSVQEPLQ